MFTFLNSNSARTIGTVASWVVTAILGVTYYVGEQRHDRDMLYLQQEVERRSQSLEELNAAKFEFMLAVRAFTAPVLSNQNVDVASRERVVAILLQQLNIAQTLSVNAEIGSSEASLYRDYIDSLDQVRRTLEGVNNVVQLKPLFEDIGQLLEVHDSLVKTIQVLPKTEAQEV